MPLQDHFQSPWKDDNPWEGFHSAWVNTIVRQLNGAVLPKRFRAFPQTHLGSFVEGDVVTIEKRGQTGAEALQTGNSGVVAAVWAPPEPAQTLDIEFPGTDIFEVRILDEYWGGRLAAVVELVSPGNKDRSESRHALVAKCAAFLRQKTSVVIVDVVTERRANLHELLLEFFDRNGNEEEIADLYAVSYRASEDNGIWRLGLWPHSLTVGQILPRVPLWLSDEVAVPLDLEQSYAETCQVLRIL